MTSATDQPATAAGARNVALLNTLVVAGGYLLSRVLGLARDVLISAQFGTAPELDAYRAAFSVLDMIYIVVAGGALGSAFIPVFSRLLVAKHEDDAWQLASSVFNLAMLGLLAACALVAVFAGPIVRATIGSGFPPEKQALTILVLRLLIVQPLLLGLGAVLKATLETFDRFALPAVGANLYNLGIIFGALALAPWLGIFGLVWGVLVGALLFVLIQLPGLRGIGARYTPALGLRVAGVRQIGALLGPRLLGQSAWQLNFVAVTSFASTLSSGAVAANGYAYQLMLLPHGLLALSLGTVLFPQLTRLYAADEHTAFRDTTMRAVRQILFVTLPAAVIMAALNAQVVRTVFERGAFDAQSTQLTAQALAYYLVGLPAFAAAEIIVRSFYAMHDTRTPVLVGVGAVALNIGLGWTLLQLGAGLSGLALAFSTANIIEASVLLLLFRRRLGGLGARFWRSIGAMHLAALVCLLIVLAIRLCSYTAMPYLAPVPGYQWTEDFIPLLAWLVAVGSAGAAVYAGVAALLRLDELGVLLQRITSVFGRLRRAR